MSGYVHLAHESLIVYGPFHRLLAPRVQDATTALKQLGSGEIWGLTARFGYSPAVKAYPGPLDADASGIEFWAYQPPDQAVGPRRFWSFPGEHVSVDADAGVAILRVAFARVTQDLQAAR